MGVLKNIIVDTDSAGNVCTHLQCNGNLRCLVWTVQVCCGMVWCLERREA